MERTLKFLVASALLITPAFGYIRSTDPTGSYSLRRTDNNGIQFYINSNIVPGAGSALTGAKVVADGNDPVTAIREALATWNRVPGADLKFLPALPTDLKHDINDGKNVVFIAETADDVAAVGGAIAITATVWYPQSGVTAGGKQVSRGDIADSDIVLNPAGSAKDMLFSTDGSTTTDIQGVLTHELGHALGENHTWLLGAVMFPFSNIAQRIISSDEQAFAVAVYPAGAPTSGTMSGRITGSGGSVVKGALVQLIDPSTGVTVGTIAGADGTYSVPVPAGSYIVYAEPFNTIFQVGNVYYLDPTQVTTGFQAAFAGGGASPTQVKVDAGASATTDVTVSAAGGGLTLPLSGLGGAGSKGDIGTVGYSGAVVIPSGQALDIAFAGGGVDATTTIQIYGAGVTVRPGTTRVDTGANFSLGPLVRATIDIAARQTPALATVLITKGGSTLSLSGFFVIVPPKPVFTSKSIVNAASYIGLNGDGVVSPGGLYSIYAAIGSALGPAAFEQNGSYDGYGKLANWLGGVNVTFDGIQAPMFLSFSGQLNVQVPFELAGKKTTLVQVNYNGSRSDKISMPVVASQPAFFTITPTGADSITGNQDFSLNSSTNPEARGRVVSIYGTGLGKLSYDVPTGAGAGGPPAGYTGNNTCLLGGSKTVSVAFTGWTPSAVGLGQWSLVIPSDSPTGAVSVKCTDVNGATTQTGTLYIK